MTKYTKREREIINAAWDNLLHYASCTDWTAEHMLKNALKSERRETTCITSAKGLLCKSFMEGFEQNPTAADLYGVRSGCRSAMIAGAYLPPRYEATEAFFNSLHHAAIAHETALCRSLDEMREAL